MGTSSTISVIICTRNRPGIVVQAVHRVLAQRRAPDEVIVVDQSDKRNERLAEENRIIYLRDPGRGAPRAKNMGTRASTGDIVIFIDDDTFVPPLFAQAHLRNYADAGIGAVAGRVLCDDDPPLGARPAVGEVSMRDLSMVANFHATERRDVEHVYGCNWSVRRSLLDIVGGFDELLHPDGRGFPFFEETELAMRIRLTGHRIVFDPDAVAEHRKFRSGGCRLESFRELSHSFYRNKTIVFLRHCRRFWLAWYILRQVASIGRRLLSRKCGEEGHRLGFALSCLRALWDGWRDSTRRALPSLVAPCTPVTQVRSGYVGDGT